MQAFFPNKKGLQASPTVRDLRRPRTGDNTILSGGSRYLRLDTQDVLKNILST